MNIIIDIKEFTKSVSELIDNANKINEQALKSAGVESDIEGAMPWLKKIDGTDFSKGNAFKGVKFINEHLSGAAQVRFNSPDAPVVIIQDTAGNSYPIYGRKNVAQSIHLDDVNVMLTTAKAAIKKGGKQLVLSDIEVSRIAKLEEQVVGHE